MAIAGKWEFEDLIPGLSDFDARLIMQDGMTPEDWARTSIQVGEVHTRLAWSQPEWARILEHPPGINLTSAELRDPDLYIPEIPLWTFYNGRSEVEDDVPRRPWGLADEQFHLTKFSHYYGPYIRGIDPPINLGRFETKYGLHSRYMHYFTPAVQAGVSLALRTPVRGKLEALRKARQIFPRPDVIDRVLEAVQRHYETPGESAEPALSRLEDQLHLYLRGMMPELANSVQSLRLDCEDSPANLRRKVASLSVTRLGRFLNTIRFSRLLKGRLLFYSQQIPWFDSEWLIDNELRRVHDAVCLQAIPLYASFCLGHEIPATQAPETLFSEGLLSKAELDCFLQLHRLTGRTRVGCRRDQARAVAEIYEPVQITLERWKDHLRKGSAEPGEPCRLDSVSLSQSGLGTR